MGDENLTPSVLSVLILDGEGRRIIAKYYKGFCSGSDNQLKFEQKLFKKTKNSPVRNEADVIMLDSTICVFRVAGDAKIFVLGSMDENEILLNMILDALYAALSTLLRGQLDARTLLDNLELTMLCVDELVDGGMILEIDPQNIVNRVLMRPDDAANPITDMSVSQALATAKDQLFKSMGNRESDISW